MADKKTTETVATTNTGDRSKWGELGEENFVDLFIPKNPTNPQKEVWLGLNGKSIWLAVGKKIKVPESVADLWNRSFVDTMNAEEKIAQTTEVKSN